MNEDIHYGNCMLTKKLEHELNMLERHILVLKAVIRGEPIGILKLAEETEFPKHKVRYSLRVLEQEGLIEPSLRGAVVTDKAKKFIACLKSDIERLDKKLNQIYQ
ncbi:MAG: hypothetical protein LRZ87_02955 [Methanocellales archaeon]|nr:hypothetical protein [Methanocellales archaeon]